MEKYSQLPMVVEAQQFWAEERPWPPNVAWINGQYILNTRHHIYEIHPGDYVIKISDSPGDFRPESPENFRKMFLKIE